MPGSHILVYDSEFVKSEDLSIGQEIVVYVTEVDLVERKIVKASVEYVL